MFKKLFAISLVALTVAGTTFISTPKAEAYSCSYVQTCNAFGCAWQYACTPW